jgi:lipopolysaccharide transport system ATP-binding protein
MSTDNVISIEGLSKAYRIGKQVKQETLASSVSALIKSPFRNFRNLQRLNTFNLRGDEDDEEILWALRDVSFNVQQGEVLGIIGRNGAGKSTLLKILSRIAEPTKGRITITGRVSALLEVGTGFHPELTGRENIYLNGTILGMRKQELDGKFDEIVDFSGVEKFLDTPVKRYSSGMKVRLAFSVAAHLEPEILIVDEVLAVGDAEFQDKCIGKMQDVATGEGRTVLFVSHNMGAVQRLCSRAILLNSGSVEIDATPEEVVAQYLSTMNAGAEDSDLLSRKRDKKHTPAFSWATASPANGNPYIEPGSEVQFRIGYKTHEILRNASIGLAFINNCGERAITYLSRWEVGKVSFEPGEHEAVCVVPDLPLAPGKYTVNLSLHADGQLYDFVPRAMILDVGYRDYFGTGELPHPRHHGSIMRRSQWELVN